MTTSEPEPERLIVELLTRDHDRAGFASGVAPLDRYLKDQALQDKRRRISVPYVLLFEGQRTILGYYTLSNATVHLDTLPERLARRLPRYPNLPATLIGRLAVDLRYRGDGLGSALLLNALRRAAATADEVASLAVIVNAKDDQAAAFYRHFGFKPFADDPNRLFLTMAEIKAIP
ncbi:MAG: GNAT family N-acetyltransferase [Alphaproteobacteria bacterium]|jgi:GNAT superfamily N-acetyltransferase|nr:GNAT family N-acetyltransferase [Alphaproteobacteria bacterium]